MTPTKHPDSVDRSDAVAIRRNQEIGLAFVNAMKLGASLLATWGIALVARLYIPRFLGPERFGVLNFAEAFATTAFVILGLGVDQYVRKEISVRPEHASDFVGGVVTLRMLLSLLIFGGAELLLRASHRDPEERLLVHIYGWAQFFIVGSNTSAGLLQATGKINGVSILSVAIKIVWAFCMFGAIGLRLPLWAFAMTVALSEGLRAIVLSWLARRQLGFAIRVDWRATWSILVASLPFLVSSLATTIYDKIGTSLLAFMTSDSEVGWYGAAYGLSSITLMVAPVVSWILTPMFARSAAESTDELFRVVRRSFELVISLSIPLALMMYLGADVWVSVLFGAAFKPAASSVRYLAIGTALMYPSIVAFNALAVLNCTWRMSLVFVSGMVINPVCNLFLIRAMTAGGVAGDGGAACAISTLLTEIAIVVPLLILLGRQSFDRQSILATLKGLAAATFIACLDGFWLYRLGIWRLLVDMCGYVAIVLLSGAVDWRGALKMVRAARMQQSGH